MQHKDTHRQTGATPMSTALLFALGHDLRSPLAAIRAATDALRESQQRL